MTDPGIAVHFGQGDLAIDDVPCLTRGWCALDLSPLEGMAALRGRTNKIMPNASGRRPRRRRIDETSVDLPWWITGAWDPIADEPHDDPVLGLALNLDYLFDNLHAPSDVTRTAVRTLTDNSTRTAQVQTFLTVGELTGQYDKPAILTITVPAGRFPIDTGS